MTDEEREVRAQRAISLTVFAAEFLAGLNTTSSGLSMEDIPEITRRVAESMLQDQRSVTAEDRAHIAELADQFVEEAAAVTEPDPL